MPRRREVPKRKTLPDPKYNNTVVSKFVSSLMRKGKKGPAESILYNSFDIIKQRLGKDPVDVFSKALENVKPIVEVKSRRVGGSTYQVPVEVRPRRRESLAFRWIIDYAKNRHEKSMDEKLAAELIEAYNKKGGAIKKKEDTHRMAEANKAFAHYRW